MPLTIDISSRSLKLLLTRNNRPEKWITVPLAPGAVTDGQIASPEDTGKLIAEALQTAGITVDKASVTLTGLSFTYRVIALPKVKKSLMPEAFERAVRKEIPMPLEEIYLVSQVISDNAEEMTMFVAGTRRVLIDALTLTLQSAGLKPTAIDLKALALGRAVNLPQALIVNFTPECFDVVLVANGKPEILHTVTPRGENALLEDNVRRLVDEVNRTVEFYNLTHTAEPFTAAAPMIITGSLANDAGAMQQVRENLEYHLHPFSTPLAAVADFPVNDYAGNIGLAIKSAAAPASFVDKTRYSDVNINFWTSKRRAEQPKVSWRQRLAPGALIVGVILLVILTILRGQAISEERRLQGEIDALQQALSEARARADAAAAVEQAIIDLHADTAALKTEHEMILGKDDHNAVLLDLLRSSLPAGVSFSSIEFNLEEVTITGNAATRDGALIYAGVLTQKGYFTEVRLTHLEKITGGFAYEIVLWH